MKVISTLAAALAALGVVACSSDDVPTGATARAPEATAINTGARLAVTTCAACHGPSLEGVWTETGLVPPLAIARGYSEAEFATLLTRGIKRNGEALPAMRSIVVPDEEERSALFVYLWSLAEPASPRRVPGHTLP